MKFAKIIFRSNVLIEFSTIKSVDETKSFKSKTVISSIIYSENDWIKFSEMYLNGVTETAIVTLN